MGEQIKKEYPALGEREVVLAQFCELWQLAKDTEAALAELKAASGEQERARLWAAYGTEQQVADAMQLAEQNLAAILRRLSERDLQDLREQGAFTQGEYSDALKAKRALALARENERGREGGLER